MSKSMVLSGPMSALRSRFGDQEAIRRMAKAGFDAVDYTFNEMVSDDCGTPPGGRSTARSC